MKNDYICGKIAKLDQLTENFSKIFSKIFSFFYRKEASCLPFSAFYILVSLTRQTTLFLTRSVSNRCIVHVDSKEAEDSDIWRQFLAKWPRLSNASSTDRVKRYGILLHKYARNKVRFLSASQTWMQLTILRILENNRMARTLLGVVRHQTLSIPLASASFHFLS